MIISLDELRELAYEEKLSKNEIEVLLVALEGNNPTEIANILEIPTENAVQKRLSKVYAKFRLTGAGPGKLHKVEKILEARRQEKQRNKKIMICWSGKLAKKQVEELNDTILNHPQLTPFILNTDMASSEKWRKETENEINSVDYVIACLGQGRDQDPLVTLGLGYLYGKVGDFKLVRFSPTAPAKTLSQFDTVDCTKEKQLTELLQKMGIEENEAQQWVNFQLSKSHWWEEVLEAEQRLIAKKEQDPPIQVGLTNSKLLVEAGEEIVKNNTHFQKNEILQRIVKKDLIEVGARLEKLVQTEKSYEFPQEYYAEYLADLQKKFKSLVIQAIAIIDGSEDFWEKQAGDLIAETSHPKSERIFVFQNEQSLLDSKKWLIRHAEKYKIYVMTAHDYHPLAEEFYQNREKKIKSESLPTKKYAIIKDTINAKKQLLIWCDEEELKNENKKTMTKIFLASQYIEKYQNIFNYLCNASNILALLPQSEQQFTKIVKGLFSSKHTITSNSSELLTKQQEIREKLRKCQTTQQLMEVAVREVRETFSAQSAALFFYGKDGRLHRRKIHGYNSNKQLVTDSWFPEENYEEGISLTGRAAKEGQPQSTNQLNNEKQLSKKHKKKYIDEFGSINCGIAVPLLGENRPFGVLRIVNKVETEGKLEPYCGFVNEEIKYLDGIGHEIASRYSHIRKEEQEKIREELTACLTLPMNFKQFADKVTKRLVAYDTSFATCILRIWDNNDHLSIVSIHVARNKEISIETNSRKSQEETAKATLREYKPLINKVVATGKHYIIDNIETEKEKFTNRLWIEQNRLKSYACFPIISKISEQQIVGTLAVYTAYRYDFHRQSCQDFLVKIASLTAAFIQLNQQNQNHLINPSQNQLHYTILHTPSSETEDSALILLGD